MYNFETVNFRIYDSNSFCDLGCHLFCWLSRQWPAMAEKGSHADMNLWWVRLILDVWLVLICVAPPDEKAATSSRGIGEV